MTQERSDSLEERLKSHAESFNGLLSLIPAKYYYGEDTTDQWQRKKQTKEQARAAKRAKLDPDNAKSAKDVLDEQAANARKRKREEEDVLEVEGIEAEAPMTASAKKAKQTKKNKREEKGTAIDPSPPNSKENGAANKSQQDPEAMRKSKAEKKREKKERKKIREESKAAKAQAKKERKVQLAALEEDSRDATKVPGASIEEEGIQDGNLDHIEIGDIVDDSSHDASSTATPSTGRSPALDASANHSGSSSVSSIAPPTTGSVPPHDLKETTAHNETPQQPKPNSEELKARLTQRIEELRRSRHADGLNGAPARTRQELIESRRQKEEARRARKKEVRQKAKDEERLKQAETLARGSPLLSNSPLLSPGSPLTPSSDANNFSFNRIAFADGSHASASLSTILSPPTKPKGPSDPQTALLAARNKKARLSSLSESQRADITEKETWLNARKRAHGERRIRDDASLLKKTLKRKEKAKKKSEREWSERIEGVKKAQDTRQRKRDANLLKRREEKKGKKGGNGKGGIQKTKTKTKTGKKARPGFEGTFRAKAPAAAAAVN